jgi:hypothetical protein
MPGLFFLYLGGTRRQVLTELQLTLAAVRIAGNGIQNRENTIDLAWFGSR